VIGAPSAVRRSSSTTRRRARRLRRSKRTAGSYGPRSARRGLDDRRVLYELGDILRHRDEPALALPCFERVAALAPDSAWALGHLVEALGVLDRLDDLRGRVATWEAAPTPASLHASSMARGWLGDPAAAAAAAEQGAVIGGGIAAQEDLLGATVMAGRWEDAERLCRALAARGSGVARMGHYGLAAVEAYRGRRAAGRVWLDALRRAVPEVEQDVLFHAVVADFLAGDGDPGPVRAEVDALARYDFRHVVVRPARMTEDELQAGADWLYARFYRLDRVLLRAARALPALGVVGALLSLRLGLTYRHDNRRERIRGWNPARRRHASAPGGEGGEGVTPGDGGKGLAVA
jgi:hypothetical protein